MNYNATNVQVVVTTSEEGEELTLRDMKGTILAVTIPQCSGSVSSKCSDSVSTDSGSEEEANVPSMNGEMACLQELLQTLENEVIVLRAKLASTEEEILQAKDEICHLNGRLVKLWQENC